MSLSALIIGIGFAVQTLNTPTFSINAPTVGSTDVGALTGAYRLAGSTVPNSFYLRKLEIFETGA